MLARLSINGFKRGINICLGFKSKLRIPEEELEDNPHNLDQSSPLLAHPPLL